MEKKLMNKYTPTKGKTRYKWYEHDLMPYIDDLKYNEFIESIDENFQKAKIINFDIIHHECRGDHLNIQKGFIKQLKIKILATLITILRRRLWHQL